MNRILRILFCIVAFVFFFIFLYVKYPNAGLGEYILTGAPFAGVVYTIFELLGVEGD